MTNRTAMCVLVRVPGCTHVNISLRNMLKDRIARSQGLRNTEFIKCQTLLQCGCYQCILPPAVYELSLPERGIVRL